MKKLLNLIFFIPLAVVLILLSVANRHPVSFILDPLNPEQPYWSFELPFFVYLFIALMIGMIMGAIATWLGQGKYRRLARENRKEVAKLQQEVDQHKLNPDGSVPRNSTDAAILALTSS